MPNMPVKMMKFATFHHLKNLSASAVVPRQFVLGKNADHSLKYDRRSNWEHRWKFWGYSLFKWEQMVHLKNYKNQLIAPLEPQDHYMAVKRLLSRFHESLIETIYICGSVAKA